MHNWQCKKCGSHGVKDIPLYFCPFCGSQLISKSISETIPQPNKNEHDNTATEWIISPPCEKQIDAGTNVVDEASVEDYTQLYERFSQLKQNCKNTMLFNCISRIKARLIDAFPIIIYYSVLLIVYAKRQGKFTHSFILLFFVGYFFAIPLHMILESVVYIIFNNTLGKNCCDILVLNEDNKKIDKVAFLKRSLTIYCCLFMFCIPQVIFNFLREKCTRFKNHRKLPYSFYGNTISKQVLLPFEDTNRGKIYFTLAMTVVILPCLFWGSLYHLFLTYPEGFFIFVGLMAIYVVFLISSLFIVSYGTRLHGTSNLILN